MTESMIDRLMVQLCCWTAHKFNNNEACSTTLPILHRPLALNIFQSDSCRHLSCSIQVC
jgi:hypothetical protein